jgi:Hydantoin racemase
MIKVGLIYTSTTPELITWVEREIYKQLGKQVELVSYEDSAILSETREAGYVTAKAAARLVTLYTQAVSEGVDAILNLCSSVGEVADAAQDLGKYMGVPIIRIDEEMCRDAVRKGKKIGVLATLPTTLTPTKNTLQRVARELGKQITLVDGLIEGAFGLNQTEFETLLLKEAKKIKGQVDVILLCQGSMAYCEEVIEVTHKIKTVSSPRYGAIALKEALIAKGLLLPIEAKEGGVLC